MSGRDNKFPVSSGAVGRLMNKIKRTVSEADEKRDPLQRGYSRVDTAEGSLSNSSTSTSLDTVVIESAKDSTLLSGGISGTADQKQPPTQPQPQLHQHQHQQKHTRTTFSPILETEDTDNVSTVNNLNLHSNTTSKKTTFENPKISNLKKGATNTSKPSLKGSKVSFEQPDNESDDSFEDRRGHFQQKKSLSATDRKGILKDLKNFSNDDRRAFQSKKHVSLDIKHSKILERILNGSSSEEEFTTNRKHFQSRKHQSLDARVKLNLNKTRNRSSSSTDEEIDEKGNLIQERIHDFSKPIVIDFKDLEASEDEDEEDDDEEVDDENFEQARSNFQRQKAISVESRKSIRFFEMDDMTGRKGDNIRQAVPFVRQITQDGKPKLEVYRPTTNPIYIYTQVLAALSVSLGSLVVGFSSGYTSPALPSMQDPEHKAFNITEQEGSWIGGIMPLAGLVGGIAGGPLIEFLGRKNTILATSIPFIISWLLIACAVQVWMVLAGRALSGFCVGVASLSLPVYLGETVQPEVRGTLGLLPTAFGNIGILMCFVAGTYMDWSQLAFLGGSLPIPFLLLMLIIPETPRWYVSKDRAEDARKALKWLRGKQADVEPELKGIIKTHTDSERHASSNGLMQLLRRNNLKPLSVSLGLMFFQQFSGINAVIFYAEKIFIYAGSTLPSSVCTIILGIVNFIATFVATVLIDRLGRKILLYISSIGMIITLATLGGYFYVKESGGDVSTIGWLPLSCLVIYVLSFSLGFGPIPWLMMGEILPAKIRGTAASVATGFNWSCTFIVTKTFADLISLFGLYGLFWIFSSICLTGLFFVIFKVPETQGKSLEDIERKMMGRIRRMSSVANIRPLSFNM